MNGYYYSVNDYYKELFGHKVYKISLNAGMSCPNRDGRIGTGGCIFCSEEGSGDFASSSLLSVKNQIDYGIEKISKKYAGDSYIAYFQAFTNTYAPVDRLKKYLRKPYRITEYVVYPLQQDLTVLKMIKLNC